MKNVMEKQLSWLAIFMTAFYSLLASCRGEECGQKELGRCARPLQKIASTSADFITTKAALDQICPDLEAGMNCVRHYASKCMEEKQRDHFLELYRGTNEAVMELCQEGPFQENFLRYTPCMQEVKPQFDICSKTYTSMMQSIANGGHSDNKVKAICCSFQDYLGCSRHAVLRKCGVDAAEFTRKFLDRMSSDLIKNHCTQYSTSECTTSGVNALNTAAGSFLSTMTTAILLTVAGRYFI